ncbi:MAG TPA: 4-hydroxyphenylacetate 3-hydroxylase N-terminal domain-containing protein [Acetobacteraceae bacterium]|nr:4-hydroxyphenylacetate 3-hydroxylase N-terminal domain-containing protein [Acetobacteraceae bacterium]
MPKNGEQHLQSLRDGRDIRLHGARIADPTTHPAFRNACRGAADLYDFQCRPDRQAVMTFETETGARVNRCWQLPTGYAALLERRAALEAGAETHFGFFGRSPDHVASTVSGLMMGIEVFEQYDPQRAAALRDYYRHARDNDLYLTYVIINPQADRSRPAHAQATAAAGMVDQDAGGIIVRGAKMLATAAIMANEVFVSSIQPLVPGDERHAISFAVPMNAPGLRILSRKSYEQAALSGFDNPLSSRFDENDAVLLFDDVRVPWERVFVNQDLAMCQRQFHATPAHVYQNYQAQIRLMVKLRFLAGLAHRIAETNGTLSFPQVRETLGWIAANVGLVEGLVWGMEARGGMAGRFYLPDRHLLYAAQVLTQQMHPELITAIRELAGGGMIMLPASIADLADAETGELVRRTQGSPYYSAEDRVQFFKLAWDAVGSEFGSRHTQYEMFYAGAGFVTKGHAFRTFDWERATGMVDRAMAETPRIGADAE